MRRSHIYASAEFLYEAKTRYVLWADSLSYRNLDDGEKEYHKGRGLKARVGLAYLIYSLMRDTELAPHWASPHPLPGEGPTQ